MQDNNLKISCLILHTLSKMYPHSIYIIQDRIATIMAVCINLIISIMVH